MTSSNEHGVEVVPVIDLRGGEVVRARGGDRRLYAPIVTPLSKTADPVDVAHGLLGAVRARRLYVADLDAIEGRPDNRVAIRRLAAAFSDLTLWIDAGLRSPEAAAALRAEGLGRLVLGSESQRDGALLRSLREEVVLSLDFRHDVFLGPAEIIDDMAAWPLDVIVMSLARVGAAGGPDFSRVQTILRAAPRRARIYAAGGVRDARDVAALAGLGVAGVLVASALHDGRLRGASHGWARRRKEA